MARIRFTGREMRHISLFESITGAMARDCIVNDDSNRLIFVVKEGEAGRAVGSRGRNISRLQKMTGKKIEVIEFSEEPAQFISRVNEVRITELPNGKSLAVTSVPPRDMGKAIGRNGRNAETMILLVKRYFQIDNVTIFLGAYKKEYQQH